MTIQEAIDEIEHDVFHASTEAILTVVAEVKQLREALILIRPHLEHRDGYGPYDLCYRVSP